jgi:hypothetical protein
VPCFRNCRRLGSSLLDSRLYPAVGLYQRDDRVTLLPVVESVGRGASGLGEGAQITVGECYYPSQTSDEEDLINQVQRHNNQLSWDGVTYIAETLKSVADALDENGDDFATKTLLPSSSLCCRRVSR